MIMGVDYHPSFQQIAFFVEESGECGERRLNHDDGEAEKFYRDLQPWQRGSNENTNGLLRQYFPKNTDLTDYSQSDLNQVALRLNQRPRQTLGFQTPASKLQESVASTH
jgi:IS30 family transposase